MYSQFCVSKVPFLLHLQLNVNKYFRLFKTFLPIICHNTRMKYILPVYSWTCVSTFISSPIFITNLGIYWCIFLHVTSFTFSSLRFVLFTGTNNNATNLHLIYINYVLTNIPTTVSTCTFYFTFTSCSLFLIVLLNRKIERRSFQNYMFLGKLKYSLQVSATDTPRHLLLHFARGNLIVRDRGKCITNLHPDEAP